MSEARFTKGEWFACFGGFDVAILNGDGFIEKQITYTGVDDVTSDVEAEANQKLIASAPEMYALLEDYVSFVERGDSEGFNQMFCVVKELLAKARGEL